MNSAVTTHHHDDPPRVRGVVFCLLIAMVVGLSGGVGMGCRFKGERAVVTSGQSDAPDAADAWRAEPVGVRVYPSTRFISVEGEPTLEAWVELYDAMGDPVKCSGTFRIDLYRSEHPDRPAPEERLAGWVVEVFTLEDHQRYYDPITQSYLFRLKLDTPDPARIPTVLRVTLTTPRDARLQTQELLQGGN